MAKITKDMIFDESVCEINWNGLVTVLHKVQNKLDKAKEPKNYKCPNCGATKHKQICEYCGT